VVEYTLAEGGTAPAAPSDYVNFTVMDASVPPVTVTGAAGTAQSVSHTNHPWNNVGTANKGQLDGMTIVLDNIATNEAAFDTDGWLRLNISSEYDAWKSGKGFMIYFNPAKTRVNAGKTTNGNINTGAYWYVDFSVALGNKIAIQFEKSSNTIGGAAAWKITINGGSFYVKEDKFDIDDFNNVFCTLGAFTYGAPTEIINSTTTYNITGFQFGGSNPAGTGRRTLGDVNGDTNVDILDLLLIKSHITGAITLKNDDFNAANLNGDDDVDVDDLNLIIAMLLKIGQ